MAHPARDSVLPLRQGPHTRKRLDPFAPIRTPALRQAAMHVSEHWQEDATELVAAQDVVFELVTLARAVEDARVSVDTAADSATIVLRSALLEALRERLLAEWARAAPQDSAAMLSILAGFERVQSAVEPRSNDGLAKRLSDPGGLELVVEVAHDLRSPLTSILFLAETMLRGSSGPLNELQRRQLGIVYSAALGLISTASDVVELARGGDRHESPDPMPFSVAAMMAPIRDLVQPMAEEKGVEVHIETVTPDHRFGHPVPLSRVLLNLTTNALKFTEAGSIEIVARMADTDRIEFSVTDTGSGIEPDDLLTLFHPFKRRSGPGSGYQFSGTGLGLTICRKLVHAMGSELHLDTTCGKGSRFYFEVALPPVQRA